ncbi:MAG TPA: type II toxin-antitoxin system VapC family toxin [Candidatus Limnocylindria bacterium]|nr:type II toxin-antitoxin system VapC family toxin [Candidatus Limnocylindria bacterium]
MITDTTFLSDYLRERSTAHKAAHAFLAAHRTAGTRATVISVGEVAVAFEDSWRAWWELRRWTVYRLHPGIVDAAADIDRELSRSGRRLGENDNWIAGFCLYYRQPIVSRDEDFDRVEGLRRLKY